MASFNPESGYDRTKEVKEFDESKLGVKGLVDAGVTTIPRIFHYPASDVTTVLHDNATFPSLAIPTVDLSLPRHRAVALASAAAREWGIFHVTNHGVPVDVVPAAVSAVQAFNELPAEAKAAYYSRELENSVTFSSNYDLHNSTAASWRDSLRMLMAPTPPDAAKIPEVCRRELLEWEKHALGVARTAMGLLSEGLGLEAGRLEGLSGLEQRAMVGHYYPYCPQPELTMGISGHTDSGFLTMLVANRIDGLLVRKPAEAEVGGGEWFKVETVPGAIVINISDALQMVSNDEYKSVEHKVVANPRREPRVSIAIFFSPNQSDDTTYFGPLPELVSEEKPARYRNFTMSEFMNTFFHSKLGTRSLQDHFRL
ncbi:hypothetical protein Taro_024973 [Colocasia esculenta]|uniref:Fe2OG dioxygenase domain-containing protein n=1 Tax=Colocasia esculenta TaxID=4460 RepID=A0A843VF70_COLES|nr:hypothetical protein [Colocasia esculenta]